MCHQTKQGARGKTPPCALKGIACQWNTREHDHTVNFTSTFFDVVEDEEHTEYVCDPNKTNQVLRRSSECKALPSTSLWFQTLMLRRK
jgi:hypothetical protein